MGTYVAQRSASATRFADLGDTELLGLFSTDRWGKLSYAEKLDACQEVENRYAAANGCEPCTVCAEPMTGAALGYQGNKTICLNENVVRDGVFLTEDVDENGATVLVPLEVRASNWQTLETVFHEGTHGLQESRGQVPSTYFSPGSDYDIYRIQPIEKQAFEAGQENTLRAIATVQAADGKIDQNAVDYLAAVKASSYQESLEAAARNYGDRDIDATVAALVQHREYGLVPQNPSDSYKALNNLLDEQGKQLEEAAFDHLEEERRGQQDALGKDEGTQQDALGRDEGTQRDAQDRANEALDPGSQDHAPRDARGLAASYSEGSETYGAQADDGLSSALGGQAEGVSAGGGVYANESPGISHGDAAYGSATQDADDGLGSASPGMDDSASSDLGSGANASNDNDDGGGDAGNAGESGRDGGQDSGGGQDM